MIFPVVFYLWLFALTRSRVKEYLPITGLADFNKLSAKLIFGADRCVPALKNIYGHMVSSSVTFDQL